MISLNIMNLFIILKGSLNVKKTSPIYEFKCVNEMEDIHCIQLAFYACSCGKNVIIYLTILFVLTCQLDEIVLLSIMMI